MIFSKLPDQQKQEIPSCLIPASVLNNTNLSNSSKLIFGRLLVLVDKDYGICQSSIKELSSSCGLGRRTVSFSIRELTDQNLIKVERRHIYKILYRPLPKFAALL